MNTQVKTCTISCFQRQCVDTMLDGRPTYNSKGGELLALPSNYKEECRSEFLGKSFRDDASFFAFLKRIRDKYKAMLPTTTRAQLKCHY